MTNRADAHTPIPWAVNPFFAQVDAFPGGALVPVCQMLWPTESRTEEETLANAARIVLAVNSHDALVEVLDGLIGAVEAEVNEKGGGGFILARLSDARAALSKATGETR